MGAYFLLVQIIALSTVCLVMAHRVRIFIAIAEEGGSDDHSHTIPRVPSYFFVVGDVDECGLFSLDVREQERGREE